MQIENIPESYQNKDKSCDLFVYDLKMQEDIVRAKVNLTHNMFSFLQAGEKQVHFADACVKVDKEQSLLIKKGNCIWSELIDKESSYYCRLLFFSQNRLKKFLEKYTQQNFSTEISSYFIIENDDYIKNYLLSLSPIIKTNSLYYEQLLAVKLEELLLYLLNKYQKPFENYLYSLVSDEISPFRSIMKNADFNLSVEEIAFLCNMSLSSFKRKFMEEYDCSPGKWLKEKRLLKAKELLEQGQLKSSDIYLELGYNNLSNFSIAFKKQFGINPSEI